MRRRVRGLVPEHRRMEHLQALEVVRGPMSLAVGDIAIFARMPDIPDDVLRAAGTRDGLRLLLGKIVRLVLPLGSDVCGYTGDAMGVVEVEEKEDGVRTQFWASAVMLDQITRH